MVPSASIDVPLNAGEVIVSSVPSKMTSVNVVSCMRPSENQSHEQLVGALVGQKPLLESVIDIGPSGNTKPTSNKKG